MSNKINRSPGHNIKGKNIGGWKFNDDEVVNAFQEHIQVSIPSYDQAHNVITKVSDCFITDGDKCIEIGCSLGELITKLAKRHSEKKVDFFAFDSSSHMINKAISNNTDNRIIFEVINALEYKYDANFVVSAFTIQFIQPKVRQNLINKIYSEMEWGGGFCLFEKVRGSDARFQDILTSIHWEWKMENGLSDEEIISKWRSLKRVMEPFSERGNLDMLKRAGFQDIETIWKWGPFQGFLAIK